MSTAFSTRWTADKRPQLMMEALQKDDRGWRLISSGAWRRNASSTAGGFELWLLSIAMKRHPGAAITILNRYGYSICGAVRPNATEVLRYQVEGR